MRRPRITLRCLMIVVAIAALMLGLEMGRRRRATYLVLEQMHFKLLLESNRKSLLAAKKVALLHKRAAKYRSSPEQYWPQAESEREMATRSDADSKAYARLVGHHSRMAEKYRRAARFPFLPVEPDPPVTPDLNGS